MTRRRAVVIGLVLVVVVAALVAVVAGGGSDDGEDAGGEYGSPTVTGAPLPEFTGAPDDPAAGREAPVVEGADFAGRRVAIGDGPQLLVFVAHWCPHCQAEVPRIVEWDRDGRLPDDAPIVAVATSTTPQRPNFPPSAWLEEEAWPFPVLVDDEASAAGRAYGLASFPYFVAVDGDGTVVARASGELPFEQLQALLRAVGA